MQWQNIVTKIVSKAMRDIVDQMNEKIESKNLEICNINKKLEYALIEISRLRSICRYIAADRIQYMPMIRQTRNSFDYQWKDVSPDAHGIEHSRHLKEQTIQRVLTNTQLPKTWFQGKKILDAGCGAGRFTYALASLGANIVAVDQSRNGIEQTARICAEFRDCVELLQHDLIEPLEIEPEFDLVWSHGVLHHTGDTYGAFKNIAQLVKPNGYLFVMIYAEPDQDVGAYIYYTEIEKLRRLTINKSFQQKWKIIQEQKKENPVDWFDAISPLINDTYSPYELEAWFLEAGFDNIKRTLDVPNHHLIARKKN